MDQKNEGLVKLMDEAIEMAEQRLVAMRSGQSDPSSEDGLKAIISGLQYRKTEAINEGYEVTNSVASLGLVRAALEYDVDSPLVKKIGDIERYYERHFIRSK